MTYKVEIKAKKDHIFAEISGERPKENVTESVISFMSNVSELCHKKNVNLVLLISHIKGALPGIKTFELVDSYKDYNWDSNLKIAVVYDDDKARKSNMFTEFMAANRGLNVKVFANEKDARTWLFDS